MKNAKKNALSPLARLSMPARIAVIATAVLLLAAIVFGIVWSAIDHSYRYDKVELGQFFAEGKNPFDYKTLEGLKKLPIRMETELTEAKVLDQIEANLKGIPNAVATFGKKGDEANLTSTIAFPDIAYMFYEVYKPTETDGNPDTLLISNTNYVATPASGAALTADNAAAGATVVRIGSGKLNTLIETWMKNHPEFGTKVTRVFDKDTVVADGYTYVIDVKGEYTTTTKDADGNDKETKKTYVALTNYYYQPKPVPTPDGAKVYYSGNEKVLTDKTAYDSSIKKADAALIAKVNEEAAKLTKIGEEIKFSGDYKIDTGNDTYLTNVTITLKAAFLAEQKEATIDLDQDDSLVDKDGNKLTFTYKDTAAGKDVTLETGKLKVRLTVETVLSLDKATVTELTEEAAGFRKPTTDDNEAYAANYVLFVKDDMMADAIAKAKKSDSYLSTLRSTLWHEIVDIYAADHVITTLPEEVYEELYESTMEYHEATYSEQYTASYSSLEEYILKAVYEDEDAAKLSAAAQAEKVDEYIAKDLRESIAEKIILFAIAEQAGLEVSNSEIRAYKKEYRESVYNTYFSYYKAIYGSTMSEGEIKLQCKDVAKEMANSYEKTYYRESVMLRKVQELLIPFAIDFDGEITWTYKGEAAHEH